MTTTAPSPMQVPDAWDAVAPTYAADLAQWADYAREALRVCPVGPSDRVLDIACGPGTLAFEAAKRAASVDAVDFSPAMIERLGSRARSEGVANVTAAVMDAQALAFADGTFDAAFCLFAAFFFPDRAKAFGEMLRVLRPGGRLVIVTWAPLDRRPAMQIGFEAVAEAMPQLPRPSKGDLQSLDECVQELTAAGFRNAVAHTFTSSMTAESAEHYVDVITRSGAPFAVMKKKIGEAAWLVVRERIVDAARRRLPKVPVDLPAEAIVTLAER